VICSGLIIGVVVVTNSVSIVRIASRPACVPPYGRESEIRKTASGAKPSSIELRSSSASLC
jgi:hypothetical protein